MLPWTVATLIRFAGGEPLLNEPDAKKSWVAHRAQRPGVQSTEVGWDLLEHEIAGDVWFLREDRPYDERRRWWLIYEQEHPPIAGYAPGILPPGQRQLSQTIAARNCVADALSDKPARPHLHAAERPRPCPSICQTAAF